MSVFSDLKPTNHAQRNGFDLSRYSSFTSKVGQIIPVFNQLTLQGGDYSLDIKQLLRTQPLNTAAFAGFTINYDVIFTPLNHLYSGFNQFIAQRLNKMTTNQPDNDQIPIFNINGFLVNVLNMAVWDYVNSFFKYNDWRGAFVQDELRFPYFFGYSEHDPSQSLCLDIVRQLDMFGYGNYLPIVKAQYNMLHDAVVSRLGSDYDISTLQGWLAFLHTTFGQASTDEKLSLTRWSVILRSNVAAYGDDQLNIVSLVEPSINQMPTLWPVLAYNKAFHEYYRNTYYDGAFYLHMWNEQDGGYSRIVEDYVQLFNFDDWSSVYQGVLTYGTQPFLRLLAMFAIKPHLYKRDLFTGVLPSTQFGDVSVMVDNDVWQTLFVKTNSGGTTTLKAQSADVHDHTDKLIGFVASDGVVQTTNDATISSPLQAKLKTAISVLESRRADAMQRFKERMLRAGDKTKDIFKAHGWTEPRSEKSWDSMFLGSFDGRLDINTVAATSESGDFNVGQLGANGVATVNGSRVNLKNTDFGIIQVLFYITKDAVYNSYGLDPQHTLTDAFDWPYPELQNISLSPVPRLALSNQRDADTEEQSASSQPNEVLGYLPRWTAQFKTALDLVHGEFYSDAPLNTISSPFNKGYFVPNGIFSSWVTPRKDLINVKDLSFMYISPTCADDIFVVNANARQESDQFIVNCFFDVKSIQPLTVIGLPV